MSRSRQHIPQIHPDPRKATRLAGAAGVGRKAATALLAGTGVIVGSVAALLPTAAGAGAVLTQPRSLPPACGASCAPFGVTSIVDLGVQQQPSSIRERDGGQTVLVGGTDLWMYGDTIANDFEGLRANSAGLSPSSEPLSVTPASNFDNHGQYPPNNTFLPWTPYEAAYNFFSSGPAIGLYKNVDDRLANWPLSGVTDANGTGIVFYEKVHMTTATAWTMIGTGVATVAPGATTGVRAPGLLFTAPGPTYGTGSIRVGDYAYVYACGFDPGCTVAKVAVTEAGNRAAYTFWNGRTWVANSSQAQAVLYTGGTQISTAWSSYLQEFVAVYSQANTDSVMYRTAPTPEGPWGKSQVLFVGAPPATGDTRHDYSAVIHPELPCPTGPCLDISYFHPLGSSGYAAETRLVRVDISAGPTWPTVDTTTTLSLDAPAYLYGTSGTLVANVVPSSGTLSGTVTFYAGSRPIAGCAPVALTRTRPYSASCRLPLDWVGTREFSAAYRAAPSVAPSASILDQTVLAQQGYFLAGRQGAIAAVGHVPALRGFSTPSGDPVVGIATTPDGQGYYAVTSHGDVHVAGDARFTGDLAHMPGGAGAVHASDIVAIAPTTDGGGYWLIGADGGEFAFGDAHYHGSIPGLGIRVHDIVGMVATPSGKGYLLVGADGGVFAFGATRFYGSLPGDGLSVHDIRGILPAPTGTGSILVGADGGVVNFGHGAPYEGSLPGLGFHLDDIVGIVLTPTGLGYWMATSTGDVYRFGDALAFVPSSAQLSALVPVVAVGGT
ncbi:MAG TPA: DUF4185 domain-containing protein [Acidimicrobiales bacterium]|nr:DUF4185 domain-containing protein [Acidimicrobiales bacterium]